MYIYEIDIDIIESTEDGRARHGCGFRPLPRAFFFFARRRRRNNRTLYYYYCTSPQHFLRFHQFYS